MHALPNDLFARLEAFGQEHLLRFWTGSGGAQEDAFLRQIESINFALVQRLVDEWILNTPAPADYDAIEAVRAVPPADASRQDAREAWEAGEAALGAGKLGLVLVAGGQGTRLGFEGPKGAFPIGPLTQRSLFAYHADKIHNVQRRYGCTLPWYIMVGESNEGATRDFFERNDSFGLPPENILFFKQRTMPCVGEDGKILLEERRRIATNPNGHGGSIPAMVENGITSDARARGIEHLSYFQVDNWAVNVADPYFIGYHLERGGEMSSKVIRKETPRESAGVFCLCDGVFRVIEYTELDIYPQLLETDADGGLLHYAANAATHILSVDFIERVNERFDAFPWHCSHKKIPHVDEDGEPVDPGEPNGYKFETFVFDALQYCTSEPLALEIRRRGEFTPIKQLTGAGSVDAARRDMTAYWGDWIEAAGHSLPKDVDLRIEISPQFALSREEFIERAEGLQIPEGKDIVIGPEGDLVSD